MPQARQERTRAAYRCHRRMVIVGWKHCDCSGCRFALTVERTYRQVWATDAPRPRVRSLPNKYQFGDARLLSSRPADGIVLYDGRTFEVGPTIRLLL